MAKLFEHFDLSGTPLTNRVVMAPMTRARALNEIPDRLTARYYAQRAGAGLIVSEGAPVSLEARGYLFNPGLYTDAQAQGWRMVTDAVHAEGGRIFAQLWHVGRVSHVSLQPDRGAPVGPTAEPAVGASAFAYDDAGQPGMLPASTPRALGTDEVARVTQDFLNAARRAVGAGFDGVELHGANGYLFEQFINGALNDRTDRYGGTIANRLRFLLETVDAIAGEIGGGKVGVRIAPFGRQSDLTSYPDEAETWLTAARELDRREPAYVHLGELLPDHFAAAFREAYRGTLVGAGGFTQAAAEAALAAGTLDLAAFGRPFIANPDFVERMRHGWPLATATRESFYGSSGPEGYTDYPAYPAALLAA